jgi:hypothetical protein
MQCFFAQLKPAVSRNSVTWVGPIQPHESGVPYEIKIHYKLGFTPKVWVISPRIAAKGNRTVDHLYTDGSLCLHLPSEWHPRKEIATTIVPWISHWLLHYEIWRALDNWQGGGSHPLRSRRRQK